MRAVDCIKTFVRALYYKDLIGKKKKKGERSDLDRRILLDVLRSNSRDMIVVILR